MTPSPAPAIEEPLPDARCLACGQAGTISRVTAPDTVEVRGVAIAVTMVFRRCRSCGEEHEHSRDPDWRVEAYEAYRAATGMVQPARLRAWRDANGLSVAEAAARAGWKEITWQRYEFGALQSAAHDQILAALLAA